MLDISSIALWACGRAAREGGRVIVEDVQTDPGFAPHSRIAASAGFRAVQSTPLFSRAGEVLGMLSGVELQRLLTARHQRLCGKLNHSKAIACLLRCDCLKETEAHHV